MPHSHIKATRDLLAKLSKNAMRSAHARHLIALGNSNGSGEVPLPITVDAYSIVGNEIAPVVSIIGGSSGVVDLMEKASYFNPDFVFITTKSLSEKFVSDDDNSTEAVEVLSLAGFSRTDFGSLSIIKEIKKNGNLISDSDFINIKVMPELIHSNAHKLFSGKKLDPRKVLDNVEDNATGFYVYGVGPYGDLITKYRSKGWMGVSGSSSFTNVNSDADRETIEEILAVSSVATSDSMYEKIIGRKTLQRRASLT